MILQAVEDEVVNGSGTPPHMRGIMNTPGIGSAGPPGTGETAADAIYAGITALRQEFLEADGIVLNPQDWQTIRLLKTTTDEYLAGSVISDDPPTLWGKRVVATSVLAPGTGLVGAFGQGAVIFDREQTRVAFAETGAGDTEGSELFTTNAIRFRAESRLAFAVTRPSAFVEVDLAA
jgi:HK97 family phage major capsid protein